MNLFDLNFPATVRGGEAASALTAPLLQLLDKCGGERIMRRDPDSCAAVIHLVVKI